MQSCKVCSLQLLLRWATTEHAGESGVRLSVGVDTASYGNQEALHVRTNIFASLGRSPAGNPVMTNMEWYN